MSGRGGPNDGAREPSDARHEYVYVAAPVEAADPAESHRPHLRIHIERLVLEGLPLTSLGGQLVQLAVEAELARLLEDGGLKPGLARGGAMPSLLPSVIPEPADGNPRALGIQVARALYWRIGA